MKIALIGYGQMGQLIHTLAEKQGHQIMTTVDESAAGASAEALSEKLSGADAAIDFSAAFAVLRNADACLAAGVPLVEGTTGWLEQKNSVAKIVRERGGAFVYGANFSVGVNLFYRIVDFAAAQFARFDDYEIFIEEQHHSKKKDVPSGTALKLAELVRQHLPSEFEIASTRAGSIPGTHRVGFDGASDQLMLEHVARSREGFAAGALVAAEWIVGRKGFYEFDQVMDDILGSGK